MQPTNAEDTEISTTKGTVVHWRKSNHTYFEVSRVLCVDTHSHRLSRSTHTSV